MQFKRRDALKVSRRRHACNAGSIPRFAKAKTLKVLILGGTGFIGPHFVDALTAGGHKITLFNRGKRDPEVKPGIEQLLGDRNGADRFAQGPRLGRGHRQLRLHAEPGESHRRTAQGSRQSTTSSSPASPCTPTSPRPASTRTTSSPSSRTRPPKWSNGETYGGLKVLCEKVVETTYGKHATIIRPTYIAGPGDHTDRFTYWPVRVSKGGEMLAPGTPSDPFQYIDVRDLADFIRTCVEKDVNGKFNLCGPQGAVTMGSLLDEAKRITRADTTFVWASAGVPRGQRDHRREGQGQLHAYLATAQGR